VADKEFELEDPFQPVAVALPTPGYDGMEAMARCYVEEYAMLGWPPDKVFRLFTIEEFAGSYSVLQERGEAFVRAIIESVFGEPFEPAPLDPAGMIPVLQRTGEEGADRGSGL
jgi:hypothetical protein